MENDSVRLSRNRRHFLGLRIRHIQNLDAAGRNLDLMVMIVLVLGFQRHMGARD